MARTTPPFVRRQKNPLTKSFCFPGISLLPSPAIISGTGGVFETYHGMADAPSDVHPILDLPSALRLLDIENRHSPSHFAVSSTSSYAEVLEKRKTNSPSSVGFVPAHGCWSGRKEPFHEIARKGPPARPQVVEQQSSGLTVSGSQQGKPSAPVGMTSVVHDGMPVIHDPDGYDQ